MDLQVGAERQLRDLLGAHGKAFVEDRATLHRGGVCRTEVGNRPLMVALRHRQQLVRRQRAQPFTGDVAVLDLREQVELSDLA